MQVNPLSRYQIKLEALSNKSSFIDIALQQRIDGRRDNFGGTYILTYNTKNESVPNQNGISSRI